MKKALSLILAVLMVVALFAGCAQEGTTTPDNGATQTPATTPAAKPDSGTGTDTGKEDEQPVEPESPYNFAAGKFEVGADGIALAPYDYELPISTTDEVLEYWNVSYAPQFIPEDGMASMPYQTMLAEKTGIKVEYLCPAADVKQQQFAVLLAADELPDLMAHGLTYYGKSAYEAITEGHFANIYDYRDYCPNFLYQVKAMNDEAVRRTVYYSDDMVVWFYGLMTDPTPQTGTCIREDWLNDLGIKADDLDTFDEIYDVLKLFKSEKGAEWPMTVCDIIERTPGTMFSGFNTAFWANPYGLTSTKVIDGKVQFVHTTQDDKDLVTMLSQWYGEGLIDPGWPAYTSTTMYAPMLTGNKTGLAIMNPGQIDGFCAQTDDPDASWTSLVRTLRYEGQKLQFGQTLTRTTYGVTTLSAKCENLPLAVSWCDWFFSTEGADFSSWGPEGITWEYDAEGNRRLTDLILNNPQGIDATSALDLYASSNRIDATLFTQARTYAYEGGQRLLDMSKKWVVEDYEGKYDMPAGFKLSDEEKAEVGEYSGDFVTYMNETYLAFFTGDMPMSEWDTYIEGLYNCNMDKILAIYQTAYENYIA